MAEKPDARIMSIGLSFLVPILFLIPNSAVNAQVIISEVMYDLDGSDSTREWIEVYNSGSGAVDLSKWRLFEQGVNHKLKVSQGNAVLPPKRHAIIADNASVFLGEYSGVSASVFDSSFSLKNSGETLILRNGDLDDVDTISYTPDWGAAGDGDSLQYANGAWVSKAPTPGEGSEALEVLSPSVEKRASKPNMPTDNGVSSESDTGTEQIKEPEFITVDAGEDRVVSVGAAEFFEAQAYQKDGTRHPYTEYKWNFGNGVVKSGKKVLHQYNYPGRYLVWVSGVTADKLAATDRVIVEAKPVNLFISSVSEGYIQVENLSKRELDLSMWSLRSRGAFYLLPQNTILLSGSRVTFSNITTGLSTPANDVSLLYPNGAVADSWDGHAPPRSQLKTADALPSVDMRASGGNLPKSPRATERKRATIGGNEEKALASVSSFPDKENKHLYVSLLALFIILGIATLAVLVLPMEETSPQKKGKEKTDDRLTADDFTIVEER